MATAKHTSVSASLSYQGRGIESHCICLSALSEYKKRKKTHIQELMDEDEELYEYDYNILNPCETFKTLPKNFKSKPSKDSNLEQVKFLISGVKEETDKINFTFSPVSI